MPKFKSKLVYSRLLILCFLGGILLWYSPALAYDSRDVMLERPKKEINLSQLDKEISGALGLKKNLGLSMNSNEDGGGQIIIHTSNQSITPTEEQITIMREAIERHIAKPLPPRADIAEYYASSHFESLEAGDIVALDLTATSSALVKADRLKHPYLIGVISENPALALAKEDGGVPLALVGRVLVKVSPENGAITVGDRITASSLPGVGMKAGPYDSSVGIALEPPNEEAGEVLVFINLDRGLNKLDQSLSQLASGQTNAWSVDQQSGKVSVGFFGDLNLNGNSIINVSKIIGMWGKWEIDENGKLIAKEVETDILKVKIAADLGSNEQPIGITIYDEITKEPYCIKMRNGQMVSVPGRCGTTDNQPPTTDNPPSPPPSEPQQETIASSLPQENTGTPLSAAPASQETTTTPETTQPNFSTENLGGQAAISTEPIIQEETATTTATGGSQ